jgi:hypothetical protein
VALLESSVHNENKVFQQLRLTAALQGCDGIIVHQTRTPLGVSGVAYNGFFSAQVHSKKGLRASCIMFDAT